MIVCEHVWGAMDRNENNICERCGLTRRDPDFDEWVARYRPMYPFGPLLAPTREGQEEIWRQMGIVPCP